MTQRVCSVPWQEVWINPELKYGLCCKENQALIDHSDAQTVSLSDHWNKVSMIDIRTRILDGESVPECALCWQNEQDGKVSMRMRRNQRYLGHTEADSEDLERFRKNIAGTDLVEGLNLSCGNLCQLRCITCNPNYSRSIKKDYDRLGWTLDHKNRFGIQNSTNRDYSLSVHHTEVLKQITPKLKWLGLLGGEPSISRPLHDYLAWCVHQGHSNHIRVLVTTNGVNVKPKFLDLLAQFQQVSLTVSMDGHGALDEYVRYPGNWQKKLQFLDQCRSRFADVDVHSVVYGLNLLAIDRLIDFTSAAGLRHSLESIVWPDSLAIEHLPHDLRDLAAQRLAACLDVITARRANYQCQADFARTVDCVQSVLARTGVEGTTKGWTEMQVIMRAYDSIRPTRLYDHVPELQGRY